MRNLIVIPSIRDHSVVSRYVKNANIWNFDTRNLFFLILIENFSEKKSYKEQLDKNNVEGLVLNQEDRDNYLEENDLSEFIQLIPKRSHAETSFGLLYLWFNKEFEYAFFIDDDTEPENSFDYFGGHVKNLNFSGQITEVSADKRWVNVLYQSHHRHGLYPRGFPYSKTGEVTKTRKVVIERGDVYISQGLWTNIPDLDAIRILMDGNLNGQSKTRLKVDDFKENFVVAYDNFTTVCSMNLAIRREIVPFFYQFPMDDNPYKIGRFDDIWSGVVAKRVLDKMGKYILTGFPLCRHNKSPRSTFRDISLEAPGYESNEHFADDVSSAPQSKKNLVMSIADQLSNKGSTNFIRYCGKNLKEWVENIEATKND